MKYDKNRLYKKELIHGLSGAGAEFIYEVMTIYKDELRRDG